MSQRKRRKSDSDIKIFSFGVDKNDAKYNDLVRFLEGVDDGARSYIIRQILNNYVLSQKSTPTFGLLTPNPSFSTHDNEEVVKETEDKTKNNIEPPVEEKETPKDVSVQEVKETKEVSGQEKIAIAETVVNEIVKEDVKKKPKRDGRLSGLANTFK